LANIPLVIPEYSKNPSAISFGPLTPPNFPVGYIPGSVIKGLARNLTSNITTCSGIFTVDIVTNDVLRLYEANVTAGNSHHIRDLRISIETIRYL
jgi:CRISPR/Cas system CMR subunit Cmr6 (Cas7 group RAMP superfamily)